MRVLARSADSKGIRWTPVIGVAALVLLIGGTTGCDEVVQAVGCATMSEFDVNVNLTMSGVQPTEAGIVSATPSGRSDLPDVELEAVGLHENQVTLNATGSGSVRFVVAVNDTVVGYGTAAVTNGNITDEPGKMNFGAATQSQVNSVLNNVPGQRPNWAVVSASVTRAMVTRALNSSSFRISAAYISTGDVTGTGVIEEVTFYLDC